jgi:hypothetical protein
MKALPYKRKPDPVQCSQNDRLRQGLNRKKGGKEGKQ